MAEWSWRRADWQTHLPQPLAINHPFSNLAGRMLESKFADKCLKSDLLIKELQESLHVSL